MTGEVQALAHSEWSASGFKQVMLCPGSKVLQAGRPDETTIYAAEGTAAHTLLSWVLTDSTPAAGYVGRVLEVDGFRIDITDDMADYVQQVADFVVTELKGEHGVVMTDQRVTYADYLGVPRDTAWGTADVIVARGDRLIVMDLKYGRGVEVDGEGNPQLQLYGLGALDTLQGVAGEFTEVELIIAQPRISREPSRWVTSVEAIEQWGRTIATDAVRLARQASDHAVCVKWAETYLRPGEEQCRFCRAKAVCPKLAAEVALQVSAAPATADEFNAITDPKGFDDDKLGYAMSKANLIEDWITGVRAEVERRLLAGAQVPGFKLVEGKLGNRAWVDKWAAAETLKSFRLKQDQMYKFTIISPTDAEKLLKKDSPIRWAKLQEHITRTPGKPSVAPIADNRPALELKPVTDDFAVITTAIDDIA